MRFKLSKESVKQLRGIVSNEASEFVQEQAEEVISFESNPMEYILNKYPSLTDTLDDLLTNYFRDYVTGIFVIAPKPTTFKVLLHNGQMFFLIYGPKSWIAKVAGKRYYLLNLNEEESAIQAIARLLELGRPPGAEGPDEATSGESSNKEEAPTEEEGGEEAAAGGEEEAGMTESVNQKKIRLVLKESAESEILSFLKKDKNIASFGPEKVVQDKSGGNKYKVYFSGLNARDNKGRKDVLSNIKSSGEVKVTYNPQSVGWSSIGTTTLNKGGKSYVISVKGGSTVATSTNVKEGLVILFYASSVTSPITENNFEDVILELGEVLPGVEGIDEGTRGELADYLRDLSPSPTLISILNQPLSQALTIKKAYDGFVLTRTGIFNEYRALANKKLGLPADKWCPGDVYIVLDEGKAQKILTTASKEENGASATNILNTAFNEKWGSKKAPMTAISLKFEKAQGGKAKTYFEKFKKAKTEYNLDDKEQKYKAEQYKQGIERLRKEINSKLSSAENITYKAGKGDLKDDVGFLRGKYAALKAINFFFTQIASPKEFDDGLVALAAFAMSLSDTSPAFFKVIANSKGTAGTVETFERGTSLSLLIDDSGKIDPIEITDSDTYGGLEIEMKVDKGGERELVKINARNNGSIQGTIEIGKITPISEKLKIKIKK